MYSFDQPRPKGVRKFLIEFEGAPLRDLPYGVKPEPVVTASRGTFGPYRFTEPVPDDAAPHVERTASAGRATPVSASEQDHAGVDCLGDAGPAGLEPTEGCSVVRQKDFVPAIISTGNCLEGKLKTVTVPTPNTASASKAGGNRPCH